MAFPPKTKQNIFFIIVEFEKFAKAWEKIFEKNSRKKEKFMTNFKEALIKSLRFRRGSR